LTADAPAVMSGVRAGAIVFVGVGVANVSTYLFHLLSARYLGPTSYGDVATLAAVSGIITLPLAGSQAFVARHVAATLSRGRPINDGEYVSGFGGAMFAIGTAIALVLLAFGPLLKTTMSIGSLWAVVFTVLFTAPAFLATVLLGAVQGSQRFGLLATIVSLPGVLRVALAAAALEAGLGVAGAMATTLVAAVLSVAIPLAALRDSLGSVAAWRPKLPRSEARALIPVIGGMLAIACLSTDDVVAAKLAFRPHEAGLYGSASLIGRVLLYLPVAVVTVLLPKVSARVSVARETGGIFARSILTTAVFCIAATAVYAAVPHLIVKIAFGQKYEGSASLLWMFGVAMTLYSLLNVLFFYRLGHGETRTSWLLLAGVAVQTAVFAGFHSSATELITGSIVTAAVLLAAAVVGPSSQSPSSLRKALRTRRAVPA
jgi:O-antigen/teichoic acid export membrane protein